MKGSVTIGETSTLITRLNSVSKPAPTKLSISGDPHADSTITALPRQSEADILHLCPIIHFSIKFTVVLSINLPLAAQEAHRRGVPDLLLRRTEPVRSDNRIRPERS